MDLLCCFPFLCLLLCLAFTARSQTLFVVSLLLSALAANLPVVLCSEFLRSSPPFTLSILLFLEPPQVQITVCLAIIVICIIVISSSSLNMRRLSPLYAHTVFVSLYQYHALFSFTFCLVQLLVTRSGSLSTFCFRLIAKYYCILAWMHFCGAGPAMADNLHGPATAKPGAKLRGRAPGTEVWRANELGGQSVVSLHIDVQGELFWFRLDVRGPV